jgi:predicted transposase YdaD
MKRNSESERERALFRSWQMYQRDLEHDRAIMRQEGLQEGRQEGRKEGQARVISLLREGYSLEQIEAVLSEPQQ